MTHSNFSIEAIAECSILIRYQHEFDTRQSILIGALSDEIRCKFGDSIMNVTPSYQTILVDYLPYRISEACFVDKLEGLIHNFEKNVTLSNQVEKTLPLPVYYSNETALDLNRYTNKGISLESLIELHTFPDYIISAIGFAPGFAFLSDVDSKLAMPRLETPRLSVPRGSVGIADSKTAVYPSQSPGGWNIIGNCPLSLFDESKASIESPDTMSLFSIGGRVKFEAIDRMTFLELGGHLNEK